MARYILVLTVLNFAYFVFLTPTEQTMRTLFPRLKYSQSYRDHVFKELSEKGKEMFYAINKHPLCLKKGGTCMQRGKCNGPDMLYISRICYAKDLVCCYDRHYIPTVARNRPELSTSNDTVTTGNISFNNDIFLKFESYANSEHIFVNTMNGTINDTINDANNGTMSKNNSNTLFIMTTASPEILV